MAWVQVATSLEHLAIFNSISVRADTAQGQFNTLYAKFKVKHRRAVGKEYSSDDEDPKELAKFRLASGLSPRMCSILQDIHEKILDKESAKQDLGGSKDAKAKRKQSWDKDVAAAMSSTHKKKPRPSQSDR